ncbi:MAG: PaaI family thioesterase [Myxococcota bacterium]
MSDEQDDQDGHIDLSGGPGMQPAELLHLKLGRSFLVGPHLDEDIIKLRWYVREDDGALIGKVWWGPGAQGPPGHAHGGSMAAVLDEALGSACWVAGHSVVAAELTTNFKKMLPLEDVYTAEAWVESVDGRKIRPRGRIIDDDGNVYAEGRGVFITLDRDRFTTLAETYNAASSDE